MLQPGGSQIFWKYLVAHPSRQVRELFLSTAIMDFAVAAITIFEPIYLFKIGFSIPQIILFYLSIYGFYFVIQPLGGKITRSRGYEHGIIFSTPFLILYYLSLFAIPYSPLFAAVAVIAFAIQKTLYWPGFHADFARFGSVAERGREFGALVFLLSISAVTGPVFGGLILKFFGFPALFVIVSLIILLSNIPLLTTPEKFKPRELSYRDAYKRLFRPEHRRLVLAHIGYGEELFAAVLWPLMMFSIIGHFATLGLIVTLGTLFTAVVGFVIGRLTDTAPRRSILRLGGIFTALSWLTRITVASPLAVLGIEAIYRSGRMAQALPMTAMTYDRGREYSVTKTALLFEMAVVIGKASAALFALLAFIFAPDYAWPIVYLLAAAYTLLYLVF
ncbi:MFS transporter [Patescibacteria group bacterium]|nr:MAG: MFS transporter [Patescibacteria group bacterium]